MSTSKIRIVVTTTDQNGTPKVTEFPGDDKAIPPQISDLGIAHLNGDLAAGFQLQQIQQLDQTSPSGPLITVFHLVK